MSDLKKKWNHYCNELFLSLQTNEIMSLSLSSEDSQFFRFNDGKVRQATHVQQNTVEMLNQIDGRQTLYSFQLTGQHEHDLAQGQALLERSRQESKKLQRDPFFVPLKNYGESDESHTVKLPSAAEVVDSIASAHAGASSAGLYAGGPAVRAIRNSQGQNHWFSTDRFFYNYSLYTKNAAGANKAVKACYAEKEWNSKALSNHVHDQQVLLRQLEKPNKKLTPGGYRVYFAPAAVSELAQTLAMGSFSYGAYKRGRSPFARLAEGQEKLSEKISFGENFALGLSPRFNSLGEVSDTQVPVVKNGILQSFLIGSKSAQEFGGKANGAEPGGMWSSEGFRSLEIQPGGLPAKTALKALGTGVYAGNLHYINWSDLSTARVTGMTRFACFWVENGEIVAPIEDMRFDDSFYQFFGANLVDLTQETELEPATDTYSQRRLGGMRIPGALVDGFRFTL